jgi:hypothetical protein
MYITYMLYTLQQLFMDYYFSSRLSETSASHQGYTASAVHTPVLCGTGMVYSPHALGMASSVNCQKSFPIAHRKVTCTSYHAHGVHVQFTKPHLCHAPTMRSHTPYTKPLRDEPTAKNGVESRHPVLSTRDTAMDLHSALISYIFK